MLDALTLPFVEFGFMRRALAGCVAVSIGAVPIGVFMVLRNMSLVGDAISHAILPGTAVAFLIAGLSLSAMTVGGFAAGLTVALLGGVLSQRNAPQDNAGMAALYLVSLALGVQLVSSHGSQVDLFHILFGSLLALDSAALWLLGTIATFSLIMLALLYRPLVTNCLDPDYLPVSRSVRLLGQYGFLVLMVLNLVAGFQALGTLLAIGLMILPATTARLWTYSLHRMIFLSVALSLCACGTGLLLSFYRDWATGPSIILCLGALYLSSMALRRWTDFLRRFSPLHP